MQEEGGGASMGLLGFAILETHVFGVHDGWWLEMGAQAKRAIVGRQQIRER